MSDPGKTQQTPNPALARTVRIDPEEAAPKAPADDPMRRTIVMNQPPTIDAVAWLVADRGAAKGTVHRIDGERSVLGADGSADVRIDDPHISEQHASLRFHDGRFTLTDLDSTNGTRLNGEEVQKSELSDGDRIGLGGTSWVFKCVVFEND
ncbi:FHA domain-containing protein [Gaopeijia maritima]|uniref:FHA domain-containing protein n=1 Tax=Gaopeijia maritima TaxID=3119007 RepID=A0ABU9E7V9_9BACT